MNGSLQAGYRGPAMTGRTQISRPWHKSSTTAPLPLQTFKLKHYPLTQAEVPDWVGAHDRNSRSASHCPRQPSRYWVSALWYPRRGSASALPAIFFPMTTYFPSTFVAWPPGAGASKRMRPISRGVAIVLHRQRREGGGLQAGFDGAIPERLDRRQDDSIRRIEPSDRRRVAGVERLGEGIVGFLKGRDPGMVLTGLATAPRSGRAPSLPRAGSRDRPEPCPGAGPRARSACKARPAGNRSGPRQRRRRRSHRR